MITGRINQIERARRANLATRGPRPATTRRARRPHHASPPPRRRRLDVRGDCRRSPPPVTSPTRRDTSLRRVLNPSLRDGCSIRRRLDARARLVVVRRSRAPTILRSFAQSPQRRADVPGETPLPCSAVVPKRRSRLSRHPLRSSCANEPDGFDARRTRCYSDAARGQSLRGQGTARAGAFRRHGSMYV